jgi:hypothetical protein
VTLDAETPRDGVTYPDETPRAAVTLDAETPRDGVGNPTGECEKSHGWLRTEHSEQHSEESLSTEGGKERECAMALAKAFESWPGRSPEDGNLERIGASLAALRDPKPTIDQLRIAALKHGRSLASRNQHRSKQAGAVIPKKPWNWIRDRDFEVYLKDEVVPASQSGDAAAELRAMWGGHAAPYVAELGGPAFRIYLAEAEFHPGPPPVITVSKGFFRDQLEREFAPKMRRAARGDFEIRVRAAA